MPSVTVSQEVSGTSAEVFKKLKAYCDKKLILKELGNVKPTLEWDEKKRVGRFQEKGVEGMISIRKGEPCTVVVKMEIPFFMIPFKGILAGSIQSHLAKFS